MTECARCGDCCEHITFSVWRFKQQDRVRKFLAAPDPSDDHKWETWWKRTGTWDDGSRAHAIDTWYDAHFIAQHWLNLGDDDATCDMFDPVSRLCTAHDQRPPVCRDFPWYGAPPKPGATLNPSLDGGSASLRCSFWVDVPRSEWPTDAMPTPIKIRSRR